MNEQTNPTIERAKCQPNKQQTWETRQLNKWLNTPISFQNRQKQCQFGSQYRKVFLSGFK